MAVKKSSKKAGTKKASPKSKAAGKRATTAQKPATRSKGAAETAAEKAPPASKPAKRGPAKKKAKGKFSSLSVNLGHVFSLRPRVRTSFRQADFLSARHLLEEEAYESIEEAARAVADKALELTHEGPSKRGFRPGR